MCERGDIICFLSSPSLSLFRHDHLMQFKEAIESREMCPMASGRAVPIRGWRAKHESGRSRNWQFDQRRWWQDDQRERGSDRLFLIIYYIISLIYLNYRYIIPYIDNA